jgi:cytochrome c oxidase subunit I+III
MPSPGWAPVLAAAFTAAFFLLLTVKSLVFAVPCGAIAAALVIYWLWDTDPGPVHPPVSIGSGLRLPVYATGPQSHSWWAMVILILVAASIFACMVFAYLFLWTASPEVWPRKEALPAIQYPLAAAAMFALSSAAVMVASRALRRSATWLLRLALVAALALASAAVGAELLGWWRIGARADDSAHGAAVYAIVGLEALLVAVGVLMALYTLARSAAGLISAERRVTADNTALLWHYGVAQGLLAVALVHGFPRLIG